MVTSTIKRLVTIKTSEIMTTFKCIILTLNRMIEFKRQSRSLLNKKILFYAHKNANNDDFITNSSTAELSRNPLVLTRPDCRRIQASAISKRGKPPVALSTCVSCTKRTKSQSPRKSCVLLICIQERESAADRRAAGGRREIVIEIKVDRPRFPFPQFSGPFLSV